MDSCKPQHPSVLPIQQCWPSDPLSCLLHEAWLTEVWAQPNVPTDYTMLGFVWNLLRQIRGWASLPGGKLKQQIFIWAFYLSLGPRCPPSATAHFEPEKRRESNCSYLGVCPLHSNSGEKNKTASLILSFFDAAGRGKLTKGVDLVLETMLWGDLA